MKSSLSLMFLSGFIFVAGCAHHRDVRPGADGVHHVVVRAQDKGSAERDAISQAEHFCQQSQKIPGIIEEKTVYTGTMDEATRDTLRKASMAAQVLDHTHVNHGTETPVVHSGPGVLGKAGRVGTVMTNGDDYRTEMKFKCQ